MEETSTSKLKKMLKKKKKKKRLTAKDFLSTGSTLPNLACTGRYQCGFAKGKYYFIVGDSISGKTFLSLTCLAEASISPSFDDYRFIYDNAEDGALMDIKKFFGGGVFRRIEWPGKHCSFTIEEFYYHVDDALKQKKPFIYILDSMDSLSSKPEADKFNEHKKAHQKGRDAPGSYGDGKAKISSTHLRRLLTPLRKSGSILIIISQTRDSLGFGFEKKARSGGHSLRFYATIEMWSSVVKKIRKTVRGKPRQLGVHCKIQIKKNRITGRERAITIPIFHSFGIDNIGSCVDYLVDENHWRKVEGIIKAKDFHFKGTKENLIKYIEGRGMEKDLYSLVGEVWNEIEEACIVERKKRY